MNKELFIIIGNNIKKYRKIKKYTISDLALATNISIDVLKKYEKNGVDGYLTFDEIDKICKFLDISIINLLEK